MKSNKKQIIWSLIFIALIVLTVWVIVKQNESFSIEGFINYVSAAKWQWIALAFLCMVGFIIFEGLAVLQLCKAFGYKEKVKRGIVYSAVDIYFSAITPSATGGQPASAMCMMQDGIPGAVTTIVLLLNLTLYTIAIIVIGAVCFIFNFDMFRHFSNAFLTFVPRFKNSGSLTIFNSIKFFCHKEPPVHKSNNCKIIVFILLAVKNLPIVCLYKF